MAMTASEGQKPSSYVSESSSNPVSRGEREHDAALALLGGGNLLAGFFGSVAMSAQQGCSWGSLTLETRYQYAFDATLDPGDPARAWLLTVSVDGTRQVSRSRPVQIVER